MSYPVYGQVLLFFSELGIMLSMKSTQKLVFFIIADVEKVKSQHDSMYTFLNIFAQ